MSSKKKLKISPFGTAVVVCVEKPKETTDAGIILTANVVERDQTEAANGIIVAMGDRAYEEDRLSDYKYPKIGDKICFKKYSGIIRTDKENDIEYRVLQDVDIYALEEYIEKEK